MIVLMVRRLIKMLKMIDRCISSFMGLRVVVLKDECVSVGVGNDMCYWCMY